MRWAFWRRRPRDDRQVDAPEHRALPDGVGLPLSGPGGGARRSGADAPDDPDDASGRGRSTPFSGATPDGAAAWLAAGGGTALPADVPLDAGSPPFASLDAGSRERCRAAVAQAVRAVLAGDRDAVEEALAPADESAAAQDFATEVGGAALAARLPALSGVAGDGPLDEAEDALLHAYADLLVQHAEAARARVAPAVAGDLVRQVAHLCAGARQVPPDAAAAGSHDPPVPVDGWSQLRSLPGPAGAPLRAVCVLLAQTCRDGAPGPDALAQELRASPA